MHAVSTRRQQPEILTSIFSALGALLYSNSQCGVQSDGALMTSALENLEKLKKTNEQTNKEEHSSLNPSPTLL